jgi:hypothetical protein
MSHLKSFFFGHCATIKKYAPILHFKKRDNGSFDLFLFFFFKQNISMRIINISAAIFTVLSIASQLTQAATTAASCDPNTCKLPNCLCPSLTPPGGLAPKDVPQFVTITFDDSIQPELLATARDLLNVK